MGTTPTKIAKQLKMNNNIAPQPNIKDLFGEDSKSESDVVKELFSNSNIKTKTDVSEREISIISRLYFLSDYIDNKQLSDMLNTLLELKISKKRLSRTEFIKALESMPRDNINMPGMQ